MVTRGHGEGRLAMHQAGGADQASRFVVWVDAWQMQCCGEPFETGSRVEWTLYEESDRDWLTAVLGEDFAQGVTHGEEHHGGVPDDAPITVGRVVRIRAVSSLFGPDPKSVSAATPVHVPIPGTAEVIDVGSADGWYAETNGLQFNGYVVDVERVKD